MRATSPSPSPSMSPLLAAALVLILGAHVSVARAQQSDEFLNAHNAERGSLGIAGLVWDATVASYAQSYAETRQGDCALAHSGGPYGENLFWSSGSATPSDAVNAWISEKADYDYNSNTCATGKVCGHYTQVVWANSRDLGCASVACNGGGTFIICNYNPPGNFVGERPY